MPCDSGALGALEAMTATPCDSDKKTRRTRVQLLAAGLGLQEERRLPSFDVKALTEVNSLIGVALTSSAKPRLFGLEGNPTVDYSWVVVGALESHHGEPFHGAKGCFQLWSLDERSLEALRQLPPVAGLANGVAKLIRLVVHPKYGGGPALLHDPAKHPATNTQANGV